MQIPQPIGNTEWLNRQAMIDRLQTSISCMDNEQLVMLANEIYINKYEVEGSMIKITRYVKRDNNVQE